ncbi:3-ketoacyl-(acyl-carrier-protein) reductase [Agrilactobacillus composti DSM 18527 = JCM 14202]|uniref:3-ketoacyl-(Acyl-carrier-protein) reductase n=1 Tax=Agrilactobacillus composti DSM 18527 = JCM 14202 TaxID=1423734 RepID=X0PUR5_9LACO|nr:3-oxoacyl-ACP reductase [Agrilactobacillus composti]KRM36762.1 3-ketoacyl-(acyl-carrier-protein) reductase [Agrilactobacillus composti DSM 18527 = JCM 14202]GAF41872.1 3-oxoacyl-[acyl-carrier protein] reductase [Agrilactobacillus composti DSM 18527 = JCM 14202]
MAPTYPELADKYSIITGSGSGIGLAQTELLLAQGTHCAGIDRQLSEPLQQLQQRYPQLLKIYQCDISNDIELRRIAADILSESPQVDFLLNTAGILDDYRPSLQTTLAQWDQFMQTDLRSQFVLTNAILPGMLARKSGKILNMASIAGLVAGGGGAVYTAAKHAVIGYTKQLDYDYAKYGLSANCLAPGAIDTPMNAADFTGDGAMAKTVADQTPARRWGHAQEVALVTLFMLSHGADFIHGAVIPIDGGWIEQ